ncbi:MAG: hypothetical protein Q8R76_07890 [Candidatus Omnitrophota bacterium]|nr:hypothetical protein [Candidatus Omnitrophota bacterium]
MTDTDFQLHYKFTFDDGRIKEFDVRLNPHTMDLRQAEHKNLPDWTKLSYEKCSNCPLDAGKHESCPIAANLTDVIDFFKDCLSYEQVDVEIQTAARTFKKRTPIQNAVSSLIGIYMVTTGCPILSKLKPMVATHLPFASLEETIYRSITTYLLAQYFLARKGEKPDWELRNLPKLYEEIQTVNRGFFQRISKVHVQDAGLNALVHLDCFARFMNMSLLETDMAEMAKPFNAYLSPEGK